MSSKLHTRFILYLNRQTPPETVHSCHSEFHDRAKRQRSKQKTSKSRKSHVFPTIPTSDGNCLDFSLQPLQRTEFPSDVMEERS
ncbi:hypothetical protein BLNAU_4387 [Blattamonas nauphoetae]|uniref:Uncharacterized protein n=1 Tax=Blattamonas nauphoetae TaxID=2049346 RepID=A0ABQ9YAD3_9EUKA|nr:hypothetical protein BLNAU_4387 [Blattamonas nauphoetae]